MSFEQQADRALFETHVDAVVATIHENERPLRGLSGHLDWRFNGIISACIRSGAVTGKPGECVFIPVAKNGRTYRLILAGAGKSNRPGGRASLPPETLRALQKNLRSLNFTSVAVSRGDFGNPPEEFFSRNFKEIPLQVTL